MSEELANTSAVADGAGSDTGSSAGDSASPAMSSTGSAPSTDVFGGENFDAAFGLESEPVGQEAPATDISDETAATGTPAPRQGEEVKEGEQSADTAQGDQPDSVEADADKTDKTTTSFEFNDKLNWDDEKAPKQFREEFKQLKDAYLNLSASSVEDKFVTEPQEFVKWMEEKSPTSFHEIGTQIATESAKANPKDWIDYFIKANPDLVAETLTGKEGMTADRLKAELAVLSAEDEEDVTAALEKVKADQPAAEPEETEDQKAIREWKEEREQTRLATVTREVFAPVETAVDELISDAGLSIDLDKYQGKNFAELDEDTQFKVMVNEFIPVWIDMRVQQDPRLVNMQARLQGFLATGDKQSALALQHHAKIAATNFAGEALSILTAKRAAGKSGDTKAPALDKPKTHVPTAGATTGAIAPTVKNNGAGENPWQVTEADMFRAKQG